MLRSYAERMKDPTDVPYVDCATTATYGTPNGFSVPAGGWTATVTTLLYWQGDTTPATFTSAFTGGAQLRSPDKGIQQLTLTVTSPAGAHQATATVVIAKRKL